MVIFVKRGPLLHKLQDSLAAAVEHGGSRHHLLVGPRGMGKTHLVALLAHRLEASAAPIRVAWLDEDPWRIRDFPTLTSAIARKLGAEPGASVDETIASAAGDGFVVVLIENLDMVFDALGTDGERQLRALLEPDAADRPGGDHYGAVSLPSATPTGRSTECSTSTTSKGSTSVRRTSSC